MESAILMRMGMWPLYVDIVQTGVMGLMALAVIYVMLTMRSEMRRASGVMNAMSQAIGEQSDLRRRLDQAEEDVAHLAMEIDRMKRTDQP